MGRTANSDVIKCLPQLKQSIVSLPTFSQYLGYTPNLVQPKRSCKYLQAPKHPLESGRSNKSCGTSRISAGEEAPAVPSDRENEKEEEIGLAARRAPAITAKEWAGNAVWARLAKYPWQAKPSIPTLLIAQSF